MDFEFESDKDKLESTSYIEIGPGPYSERHWQPGYTFISEDAFVFVEGLIRKHFGRYDHFSMNDIPSRIVAEIAEDLRIASEQLARANEDKEALESILSSSAQFRTIYEAEIIQNRKAIVQFVQNASDLFYSESQKSEVVCIMGI